MTLTYWPCGGDILAARGQVIAAEEAARLHRFYLAEARLSAGADDHHGCARALRLAMELRRALANHRRWRQAAAGGRQAIA